MGYWLSSEETRIEHGPKWAGGAGPRRRCRIGSHVAEVLAECGATIVVGYRSNAQRAPEVVAKAANHGGTAHAEQIDVTDYDAARAWVARCSRKFGKLV